MDYGYGQRDCSGSDHNPVSVDRLRSSIWRLQVTTAEEDKTPYKATVTPGMIIQVRSGNRRMTFPKKVE